MTSVPCPLMIRKEIRADVGYSVVEFDGARRIFAAVAACRGVTLSEQAESALQTTQAIFRKEGGFGSMVMQSVFLKNIEDQAACRQIFEAFYGQALPATSYIPQPPCDGKLLSIEAWGLAGGGDRVQIERLATEWLLPGTMVLFGLTLPMSIPRPRHDRLTIDRSRPFAWPVNG